MCIFLNRRSFFSKINARINFTLNNEERSKSFLSINRLVHCPHCLHKSIKANHWPFKRKTSSTVCLYEQSKQVKNNCVENPFFSMCSKYNERALLFLYKWTSFKTAPAQVSLTCCCKFDMLLWLCIAVQYIILKQYS